MSGINKANQRQGRVRKPRYDAYRHNATKEKNKAYRLLKTLEKNPNCVSAQKALDDIPAYCVKAAKARLMEARGGS